MEDIVDIHYRPYRPAGYSDDLGVIADRNQWLPKQLSGWYITSSVDARSDIIAWLQENGICYSDKHWAIILHDKEDAALFKLRWS